MVGVTSTLALQASACRSSFSHSGITTKRHYAPHHSGSALVYSVVAADNCPVNYKWLGAATPTRDYCHSFLANLISSLHATVDISIS